MNNFTKIIREYLDKHLIDRRVRYAFTGLAAIIVFTTTYMLIYPALTLEKEASCGIEEHEHTSSCYSNELICGLEESEGHDHTDDCYLKDQELVCELDEHEHDDECFDEEGDLICDFDEHAHADECYKEVRTLICGQDEMAEHHHTDACYAEVFDCDKETHVHSVSCYDNEETEEVVENAAADTPDDNNDSEEEQQAPLPEIDFAKTLTDLTSLWYQNPDGTWTPIGEDTTFSTETYVLCHIAYDIPQGSLDKENSEVAYKLPESFIITDEDVNMANADENNLNQLLTGYRLPNEMLSDQADEYLAGDYVLNQDEKGRWQIVMTFNDYSIESNSSQNLNGWFMFYMKGSDLEINSKGNGKAVFAKKAADGEKLQIKYHVEEAVPETIYEIAAELTPEINYETQIEEDPEITDLNEIAPLIVEEADEYSAVETEEYTIDEAGESTVEDTEEYPVNEAEENAVDSDVYNDDTIDNSDASIDDRNKLFFFDDTDDETEEIEETQTDKTETDELDQDETEEAAEETEADDTEESADAAAFPAQTFNKSTGSIRVKVLAEEGTFPEGTTMTVEDIDDDETVSSIIDSVTENKQHVQKVQAVDIKFFDAEGDQIEPLKNVCVIMEPISASSKADITDKKGEATEIEENTVVVHVENEGNVNIIEQSTIDDTSLDIDSDALLKKTSEKITDNAVIFEAESFSVYALVYTVDFHWQVDGKEYKVEIPGGGFVSFYELIKVLRIAADDESTEKDEVQELVDGIENIDFSDPELVSVSKVEEDTTVGAIKKRLHLDCKYSEELTKEDIKNIDAQEAWAGDWALIALNPFTSEETLTITMKDGEVWTVKVTDAIINYPNDIVSGNTYYIYTYSNGNNYAMSYTGSAAVFDPNSPVLGNEYMWKFTSHGYWGWEIQNVADPSVYVKIDENGVTGQGSTNINIANWGLLTEGLSLYNSFYNLAIDVRNNPRNDFIVNYSGSRIRLADAVPVQAQSRLVTLHFVDENGEPLSGLTYNGMEISGSTFDVTQNWLQTMLGTSGELNLENFSKAGYTLSNTHKSTYKDLNGKGAGSYPHTIIGNSLKWTGNKIQYRLFYTNNDKAGSYWFDAGMEPKRETQYWQYDNSDPSNHTAVKDDDSNPYDYYLVYSPTKKTSGGSGQQPSGADDIGELQRTKTKSSNYDGTYNLELGVSSKAIEEIGKNHINILMVIDTSSSMNRRYDSETQTQDPDHDPNSRIYQTRQAVKAFVTELVKNNQTDPNAVELELITFDMGARVSQTWTTNGNTFNNVVSNIPRQSGTNWAEALELARTEALAKNDGDPTYVLFLTDGAPSQYWNSSELSGYYVSGEGCYLGARDEARSAVLEGINLYSIFSYGTTVDQNNDYLGKLMDYAYNSSSAKDQYRYYVSNQAQLQQKLMAILKTIEKHFGAGDVQINDGITELTTVTFEHDVKEDFAYTIKYRDYTDENDPSVYVEHEVPNVVVTGEGNDQRITIPSVTYGTWQKGVHKNVTTKEVTIKGAQFSADPSKTVTWKLEKEDGSVYILEDNWTYNVKFKIWPSQDTYDLLAALNNGFLAWGEDFVNGDHTIKAIDYMEQIDSSVQPYALRTNTIANVTYKEYTSRSDEDGNTSYVPGEEKRVLLPTVDGMPLDNTKIILEKVWNTTLSSEDYDKINSVDLYIMADPTPEKIAAFNSAYAAYKADQTPENLAAFNATYYYKALLTKTGLWKAEVSIAPGIYDQYGHMNTTGHTYMVLEPDIDGHYELEATPTHPMLNGLTHNENDPNTIKDMVDVYDYDTDSLDVDDPDTYPPVYVQENQKSRYSVANTLKAGININKELVGVPASKRELLSKTDYFTVKVTLQDKDGVPVYSETDGMGNVAWRITAPAVIPEDAEVVPSGAEGNDVTGYIINNITYEAEKTDGVITGFAARGLLDSDGTAELKIRECDSLRIVNVPIGTVYTVEETDIPGGSEFSFKELYWEVKKSGEIYKNMTDTISDISITETIVPDAENNVVVRNRITPGSLKLTKLVRVDGNEPTQEQYTIVDGQYIFKVDSVEMVTVGESEVPAITKYVAVIVTDGAASAYKVADTLEDLETAEEKEGSWALITDLMAGDYTITETEERNGLMLTGIQRGDENADAVDYENDRVTVHVTSGDSAADNTNAQASFTNNHFNNDGPDRIAIDLMKTFEGLVSVKDIPDKDNFHVVLSYSVPGNQDRLEITLSKGQNETIEVGGEHITIKETTDGYSLKWHITNLPNNATDFKIREVGYDAVAGYDWSGTTLNDETVEDPSQDSDQTVLAPSISFTRIMENEINPDNDLTFDFNDQMIWLLRATSHEGVYVISVNSLSYSTRIAVENFIHTNKFPQGKWSNLDITYYSYEDRQDSLIKVHGYEIQLDKLDEPLQNPEYDYQLTIRTNQSNHNYYYKLTYDEHSDSNSFRYVNSYDEHEIPLDIVKVEKGNKTKKLPGAQFSLRKLTNDQETGYPMPTNNGTFFGEEVSESPVTTDADGKASFTGLTQGYYELTETKAPDGYILTDSTPVYFLVDDGIITWIEWSAEENIWITKTTDSIVSFEAAKAAVDADPENGIEASEAMNATFTIENTPGSALPNTGGPGTRMIWLFGIMLAGLASTGLTIIRLKRQ